MPDKIEQALRRLSSKERSRLKEILLAMKAGTFKGLDVVKLKGHRDIYRVRKGDMRLIFSRTESNTTILSVERRSEKTYKDF